MFRNLFGGGQGARGFRPRHDRGGIHFLFPLVVGVVSGYYIFNEPLKQAVIEVKAKEARERAGVAGGGERSSGSSSVVSSGGGGSGGGGGGGVDDSKPRGATVGSGGSKEVDR